MVKSQIELSRRQFISRSAAGIGTMALSSLLSPERAQAKSLGAHFPAKAKRVIWLTQAGAPSQLDLFDYKPNLKKRFGEQLPNSVRAGQRLTGMTANQKTHPIAPSVFQFQQHGAAGMYLSELLPHTAKHADKICLIRTLTERCCLATRLVFIHLL